MEVHDLETSQGAQGRDERAYVEFSIRALSDGEGSGHAVAAATRLRDFEPAKAGRRAGETASKAGKPQQGEEGRFDVVLDPLFFGALVDAYTAMASAQVVMAGMSMLAEKVGQEVASPLFTLEDDPSDPSGTGRRLFDAEGVPARRTAIVEGGVLKGYLHNTSTAKRFDVEPTGSATFEGDLFGGGFLPPSPSTLLVGPGDYDRAEIFSEVKDGLYLTNTWYTRFQNRVRGDFSTIPRDAIFRIRDGEVVGSWKDVRVTENLLDIFRRIEGLTHERHQVHWWGEVFVPTFAPYALVRDVGVTRAKE
jgi:PmbA protein